MRLVTPANGVVVDVPEGLVERYKARGYKPEAADAPKAENGADRPRQRQRRKA